MISHYLPTYFTNLVSKYLNNLKKHFSTINTLLISSIVLANIQSYLNYKVLETLASQSSRYIGLFNFTCFVVSQKLYLYYILDLKLFWNLQTIGHLKQHTSYIVLGLFYPQKNSSWNSIYLNKLLSDLTHIYLPVNFFK